MNALTCSPRQSSLITSLSLCVFLVFSSCTSTKATPPANQAPVTQPGAPQASGSPNATNPNQVNGNVGSGAASATIVLSWGGSSFSSTSPTMAYRLSYLTFQQQGPLTVNNGLAQVALKGLPTGQAGTMTFEISDANVVQFRGQQSNLTLSPGANQVTINMQQVGGSPSNSGQPPPNSTSPSPSPNPNGVNPPADNGVGWALQGLTVVPVSGWTKFQELVSTDITGVSFSSASDYFVIMAKQGGTTDMNAVFVNGSTIDNQSDSVTIGRYQWKTIDTHKNTYHVAGFSMDLNGFSYYGYARSTDAQRAAQIRNDFLNALQ